MSRKKLWIPAAIAAVALVLWAFVRGGGEASATYRFVTVERGTVESVVTSTGTLQATETVEVGTQVSGQVAEILVDFNDRVQKGQLLARIDPTILQQEVRAAEANVLRNRAEVEQATRALERNRELHGQMPSARMAARSSALASSRTCTTSRSVTRSVELQGKGKGRCKDRARVQGVLPCSSPYTCTPLTLDLAPALSFACRCLTISESRRR